MTGFLEGEHGPRYDALADAELAGRPRRPKRLGAVRLPLAGPYRPLATLYELPDGRRLWCVRLWDIDRPVRRCLSTGYLLAFARLNGLAALALEIRQIAGRGADDPSP